MTEQTCVALLVLTITAFSLFRIMFTFIVLLSGGKPGEFTVFNTTYNRLKWPGIVENSTGTKGQQIMFCTFVLPHFDPHI